jgi:hypothetical protein
MGRQSIIHYGVASFAPPWNVPFDLHVDQQGVPDLRCRRCIVISGTAGCGKTSRALAEWGKPLLCKTIEDASECLIAGPNKTTHIVFDEADFSGLAAEDCINLLDCDKPHCLPARSVRSSISNSDYGFAKV